MIINIFGLPGTGKSTLRNALIEKIGKKKVGRIPGDHYLKSRTKQQTLEEYFSEDRVDWELLNMHLSQPIGTLVYAPDINWNTFRRLRLKGSKTYIIRNILIIDTVNPCLFADYKILLTLPNKIRKMRITQRNRDDSVWKNVSLKNWDVNEDEKRNIKFKKFADLVVNSNTAVDNLVDEVIRCIKL